MKNYRLKINKPDWSLFLLTIIIPNVALVILFIFEPHIKAFIFTEIVLIIIVYSIFGKYPYWIVRKKEIKNEKL